MKKKLSKQQEFEILKLVLDKFLLVGFAIMLFGMWQMYAAGIAQGLIWIAVGAILLLLFVVLIVKEYEIIR